MEHRNRRQNLRIPIRPRDKATVKEFSDWCTQNFLELDVGKTKEMVVGFKRDRTDVALLAIGGQTVERVQEYRYLGTVIDDKFTFNKNTAIIHKKNVDKGW